MRDFLLMFGLAFAGPIVMLGVLWATAPEAFEGQRKPLRWRHWLALQWAASWPLLATAAAFATILAFVVFA